MIFMCSLTTGFEGIPNNRWSINRMIELQDGAPFSLVVQAAFVEFGLLGQPYLVEKTSQTSTKLILQNIQQIIFINYE